MLSPALVAEVRRLLTESNLSQRKIALITGVSRASIGLIASGKRPDYPVRCNPDEEEEAPRGPAERCRSCGGMVFMPCRLCRVRAIKKQDCDARRMAACRFDWGIGVR